MPVAREPAVATTPRSPTRQLPAAGTAVGATQLRVDREVQPRDALAGHLQRAVLARAAEGNVVTKENAKAIIDQHLLTWYTSARMGVEKADVSAADESLMWFSVAAAGNMLWAATAFVAPEAVIAIRVMSLVGAAIGSGTIATGKQLLAQKSPSDALKQLIVRGMSARYARLQKDVGLTDRVFEAFQRAAAGDAMDAGQAHDRRELAWRSMFKDSVPYNDLAGIENETKANVEAIWAQFKEAFDSYVPPWPGQVSEERLASDVPVLFNRALRASGVEAQVLDAEKAAGPAPSDPFRMLRPQAPDPYAFRRPPIWVRGTF